MSSHINVLYINTDGLTGHQLHRIACEASLAVLVKLPNLKRVRNISASSRTVSTWMIRRDDLKNKRGGCNYKGYEVNKTEVFPDFEESQRLIAGLYK